MFASINLISLCIIILNFGKHKRNKNRMEVFIVKYINCIALTLVIIGAINWLLVGLFEFNLVDYIFGSLSALTRIIYTIVGIAGLWSIAFYNKIAD